MSIPNDDVMREAFRRAQMRGLAFPQLCDFPPSVSRERVEIAYLAPLRRLIGATTASASTTPSLARLPAVQYGPLEYTTFSTATDTPSFVTSGGDAWAAVVAFVSEEGCER